MPSKYPGSPEEVRALSGVIALLRCVNALEARLHAHLPDGLTVSQFAVLETLLHLGPLKPCEIGPKILVSPSNLCTVIRNLEKAGLIERIALPDDQRTFQVALSAAGRKLIGDYFPAHAGRVAAEFSVLQPWEQEALTSLCKRLGKGRQTPS
ncbi:MAG: hypothetical protein RL095_4111 [Verrucomicrobiota bacterium]|jgi:MarR family 2-MHQ and catechol resistance regulon transcriptional repressor